MGDGLDGDETICADDAVCAYFPNAGAATTGTLSALVGEEMNGSWQVCMGDSTSTDDSRLYSATLDINQGCTP
jgi:hypothetical protein